MHRRKPAILALTLAPLLFTGCFDLEEPVCAFRCGSTPPQCPDRYTCRSDGYCHRIGTTAACPFSDAAVLTDQSLPNLDGSSMDQTPGPPDADGADDLSSPPVNVDMESDLSMDMGTDAASDLLSLDLPLFDL